MKKTLRVFLLILAVLLIAAAIPFAAVADPIPADNVGTLTKLMDVPNLATTITEGTYTLTASGLGGVQSTIRNEAAVSSGVSAASGDKWFGYVSKTNIPLTAESHYVFTYTAQYFSPIVLMGFSFLAFNNPNKNANIRDQALTAFFDQRTANSFPYIYLQSNWANYNSSTGIKHEEAGITADQLYQENDFVIAIDGWNVSLYMNQEYLGTLSCEGWKNYSPYLAMGTCLLSRTGATQNAQIASFSNIKLYEGTYELYKTVTFGGAVTGSRTCTVGNTVGELPAVSTAEDEVAVWCLGDTDRVVDASFVVKKAVTLNAIVYKKSASKVYGIQVTTPSENKQGVRFVSILQSLEGQGAGFEIIAKYKNGEDPVVTSDPYELTTHYVYSSITAIAGGLPTTVKATDMGGSYVMAIAIDDVPTDMRVDFLVRSFVVVDGNKVYSDTVVFKLSGGSVDQALEALS